jgi:hypothetical protein
MTGYQKRQFEEAFLSAFNSYSELERIFSFELDVDLKNLSNPNKTMPDVILDIIKWAESHNKIQEVINAALNKVPGNIKLIELINSMNTTAWDEKPVSQKESIEQLIKEDKIEKAINELTEGTKNSKQDELYNGLILLSARFKSNEKENMLGIANNQDYKQEKAKIIVGLQYFLGQYKPNN